MKWFTNVHTLEDLKAAYKMLAMSHHPDRGGNTRDMQEINAEYDELFAQLKNTHEAADGTTYTAAQDSGETPEEFKDIISQLINIPGIDIELCGSWLWVTGDTYTNREFLKSRGFKYSKNKNAWYWHGAGYRKRHNKSYSLDEIRDMFGSEKLRKNPRPELVTA